jgi:hypothetical protein
MILLDPVAMAPHFSAHIDKKDTGDMLLLDYRKQNGKANMLLSLNISPSDTVTFNAVHIAVTDTLPSGGANYVKLINLH